MTSMSAWGSRDAAVDPDEQGQGIGGALHGEAAMRRGRPGRAGQGIGGALHNALITGLPHGRALLPTYRDERPAPGLATARGWEHLVEGLDEDSDLHGLKIKQAR